MASKATNALAGYVTLMGACEATGQSYWTLYKTIQRKQLPTIKVGRTLMIKLTDIQRALVR